MPTYVVTMARDFIPPCGFEKIEVEASNSEQAASIALAEWEERGQRGFVSSVWAKDPPRFEESPLERALRERDEARGEALDLRDKVRSLLSQREEMLGLLQLLDDGIDTLDRKGIGSWKRARR